MSTANAPAVDAAALPLPEPGPDSTSDSTPDSIPVTSRFQIGEQDFLLDGEPLQILSGALHYFRIHPDHWADRIAKARQLGLNTIETYVAWNAHSPRPGEFHAAGGLDLGRFLDLIAESGMYAIVRPGPYICAEWTNGGLPAWLFRDPGTGVRRNEPGFMAAISDFYHSLAPIIAPRQIDRDGSIILVQVENEYGAYGSDKTYLRALADLTRRIGITVPLTTVDQPVDDMLERGGLPELHKTGSFGSRIAERLDTLRRHQPTGPLMCSEFWDGWFDSWGLHHHTTPIEHSARDLDELLARGASVNIYMLHGGTNFGFTNGANDKGVYQPITTSYDYDAPLDEAGNPTAKYWAFREVIAKYAAVTEAKPEPARPRPQFSVPIDQTIALWDVADRLGTWSRHQHAPSADELDHYDGFTVYRAEIDRTGASIFEVEEVRDRAQVFLNRAGIGALARDHHDRALALPPQARGTLELLVEDQGRVDYGPRLGEPKGLIGPVRVNGEPLNGWSVLPLNLAEIEPVAEALRTQSGTEPNALIGPVFARATFDLSEPGDLYLDTSAWGKGVVWINGFCLGRYWSRGPQRTLYVPGPVLQAHDNELIVFEQHATGSPRANFVPGPDLGHTEE
jgi:beta-galactosidase